jgi:hypothetical protein
MAEQQLSALQEMPSSLLQVVLEALVVRRGQLEQLALELLAAEQAELLLAQSHSHTLEALRLAAALGLLAGAL